MKNETYPLALPPGLLGEVRKTARQTGLSLADAMRQSIKLGLPKLREQLCGNQLQPFSREECRRAFGPNAEFDALESHLAQLPVAPPEE